MTDTTEDIPYGILQAQRKLPGHCSLCGRPNNDEFRTCERCRVKRRTARKNRREKIAAMARALKNVNLLHTIVIEKKLLKRLESLELAVANLQLRNREQYCKGYEMGRKLVRKRLQRRIDALRGDGSAHRKNAKTSFEELTTLSHVYVNRNK